MLYSQKVQKKRRTPKPWMIVAGAALAIIIIVVLLEVTNTTHLFHKDGAKSGVIPSKIPAKVAANTAAPSSANTATNTTVTPTPSDKSNTPPAASPETPLPSPASSTFVSSHTPKSDQDVIESQCVTLPGATCYIKFTKGGIVKTLDEQTVGTSGAVYWEWKNADAHLEAGSWQVSAVAKLGTQTQTATDTINLEIQP